MKIFKVLVERTETYLEEIEVAGEDEFEVADRINDLLREEGWDFLFPGTDGNYIECHSEVVNVEEKKQ